MCPNLELDSVRSSAEIVIFNFKMTFKYAYPRSTTHNIFQMTTTFRNVTWSKNQLSSLSLQHCIFSHFSVPLIDAAKQHIHYFQDFFTF